MGKKKNELIVLTTFYVCVWWLIRFGVNKGIDFETINFTKRDSIKEDNYYMVVI